MGLKPNGVRPAALGSYAPTSLPVNMASHACPKGPPAPARTDAAISAERAKLAGQILLAGRKRPPHLFAHLFLDHFRQVLIQPRLQRLANDLIECQR